MHLVIQRLRLARFGQKSQTAQPGFQNDINTQMKLNTIIKNPFQEYSSRQLQWDFDDLGVVVSKVGPELENGVLVIG